jgi:arginine repressor
MTSIDDFKQQICDLIPTHTREAIRDWLQLQGVQTSISTISRRLTEWQAARYTQITVNHPDYAQLTEHINYLFHHQPTYSDT